ncbi:MAG TPA: serine hydrolase domain-containing protein [Anaerolineales bacterium]|nr:serine hydrolase domain-containing protein [Anaerolineales bacterium]
MNNHSYRETVMVRNHLPALLAIVFMIVAAFGPAAPAVHAAMEAQSANQVVPASDKLGLKDPQELEAFLDSWITTQLSEEHVAGATVAVVKDGNLFLAKGYGYADVEAKIAVDADTTLFRVGSIGKLFTWTAVMQLAEQGQLDLDADINQYIDFAIPATFPQPITLEHLMTHTAGFEDTAFGFASMSAEDLVPLRTWLVDNLPARAWPPGQVVAYSNYGAALAGYIVERVSGVPYEDYVEQNILAPLGMMHSTPRQPLPAALESNMSRGYKYLNESFHPQGFAYLKPVPAGSMSATATDMARFMIAHLQQGRYCETDCAGGEARILEADTAQQMHSRLWAADDDFNGMAHGFMELSRNGYRVIGHFGDITSYHSMLTLLPEENIGFFISYNSEESRGIKEKLFEAFMDRYFPAQVVESATLSPDSGESDERIVGRYQQVRYAYSKGGKILSMFDSFPVQAENNGELIIDFGEGPQKFVQIAPRHYKATDGDLQLVFRENTAGDIAYLNLNNLPMMTFRKVAWYETMSVNLGLLAGCAVMFLLVLVVEPLRLLVGWFRRRTQSPQPAMARLARGMMVALALLALLTMAGLYWQVIENFAELPLGQRGLLPVLGGISIFLVALVGGIVVLAVLAWRRGWWGAIGRIYYSLIALASVAFAWFLVFWNQTGWQWW